MRTVPWLRAVNMVCLLLFGCGARKQPSVIHDTTGASFDFYCDGMRCPITARPGSPPPTTCGGNKIYAFSYYRFIQICAATSSDTPGIYWSTSADRCRLVACSTDDECPQFDEYTYECRNHLCQAVSLTGPAVQRQEAELLCLGPTNRAHRSAMSPLPSCRGSRRVNS